MNFGAIIIGDEILSGKRIDQHFNKLVRMLAARGLRLSWSSIWVTIVRVLRRRCGVPSLPAT